MLLYQFLHNGDRLLNLLNYLYIYRLPTISQNLSLSGYANVNFHKSLQQ
ncbi:MAG: hypothetical protein ACK579_21220 [Dolichospermum sp.]